MVLTKSSRDVERVKHRGSAAEGPQTWVTTYLGPSRARGAADAEPPLGVIYPVAYIIDSEPGKPASPHFHQANQFQVIVGGDGFIGKHPVQTVSVHYASAYTPYGPIVPGAEGISYMTMRNSHDPGAKAMPRERELLKSGGRKPRAAVSEPLAQRSAAELLAQRSASCEDVLMPQADGLGSWLYHLPPGAELAGPEPREGGGQFWLVIAGELTNAGAASLPRLSCVFVSPDEPALHPRAGASGCDVLAMQYPLM